MLQASSHATDMPESRAQEMSAWRLRYALMLTDSLSSILFDARRNTCHCLLLNYWVRCGGLQVGRLIRPNRSLSTCRECHLASAVRCCHYTTELVAEYFANQANKVTTLPPGFRGSLQGSGCIPVAGSKQKGGSVRL